MPLYLRWSGKMSGSAGVLTLQAVSAAAAVAVVVVVEEASCTHTFSLRMAKVRYI